MNTKQVEYSSTIKEYVISTLSKLDLEYISTPIQEKHGTLSFIDNTILEKNGLDVRYIFYKSGYFRRQIIYVKKNTRGFNYRPYYLIREVAIYQLNDKTTDKHKRYTLRKLEDNLLSMLDKTIPKIKSYRENG